MADIRLAKPAAGTSQNVVCTPEARFVFEFPTDEATLSRNGDNLVITFEDGSTLQLENFYTAYSSENMPSFSVDGAEISGQDFFTAMNEPDLMPAAGPAGNAGNQSNGNRFHDYVNADLLDGLDRLGGLDIGWPGSDVNPETDGAATSGDYVDIDYGVTVTPGDPGIDDTPVIDNPDNPNDNPPAGVVADRDVLRVQESNLADGTNPNADALSADGFMNIDAPDGVASITIGSVTVFENGALTGAKVPTDEGYLEVTGFDPATGRLDYTYHLTGSTQEHEKDTAADDSIAHELPVTVTDTDGSTGSGVITVVIEDDVPTLTMGEFTGAYGEGIDGTVKFDFGADRAGATIELSVNGSESVTGILGSDGKTWTFEVNGQTVTLNAETGEFHYALPASGSEDTYTFQFTVKDADGDVVSNADPVDVKVEGTDLSEVKGSVTGDDDNVLTGQAVDVDMPELPEGVTLDANQTVDVTDAEGNVYGQLIVDTNGNVTFVQTAAYSGEKHNLHNSEEDLATGFSGNLNVTLDDGTASTITVDVSILDDMPTLTLTDANTDAQYGQSIVIGTLTSNYGADGANTESSLELSINGTQGVLSDGVYTFAGIGTATIGADGKISFQPESTSGKQQDYTLSVTIKDADDDTATDNFTFRVEGTDLSEVKGSVTGDDDNVLTGQAVDVDMPELPEGVTLDANQTVDVTDAEGNVYGQLIVDTNGNVTFVQTAAYSGEKHNLHNSEEDLATGFSGNLNVTLDDGTASTITVDVSILDDMPTIEENKGTTDTSIPGVLPSGEAEDFRGHSEGGAAPDTIWNGKVEIYTGTVKYTENQQIDLDHSNIDNQEDDGFSVIYRPGHEGKFGLGIAENGNEDKHPEFQYDTETDTAEAIVFDLGDNVAYSFNVELSSFFAENEEGQDETERALITFFDAEGNIIWQTTVSGADGTGGDYQTQFNNEVLNSGFSKVVISPVEGEKQSFNVAGVDFGVPIAKTSGTVTTASGADGYENDAVFENGRFDYQDGDTRTVRFDGEVQQATLSYETDGDGVEHLKATLGDGTVLFNAELDAEGNWSFLQFEEFEVKNENGWSSNFELKFETQDGDGDIAGTSVTVPLDITDVKDNAYGTAIDNDDDTITITGGDGVAGTIAAGDTGGASVNEVVQPGETYNISIMLDLSGSMKYNLESGEGNTSSTNPAGSRMEMAVDALESFFQNSIQGHDGTVNIQLVGFGTRLWTGSDTLQITADMTSDQRQAVYDQFAHILENWQKQMFTKRGDGWENVGIIIPNWRYNQGTNYEAALEKATQWFNNHADNGGENLAFFISDGEPTYSSDHGNGSSTPGNVVEDTLHAAQTLQNAGGGVKVNAIGIGTSVSQAGQEILDLIDNTGGTGASQMTYPYEDNKGRWKFDGEWTDNGNPLILGDSDLVYTEDGLTAALQGGSSGLRIDLSPAGDDTIYATSSDSSAIIYGDAVNTDMLRAALLTAGIDIPEELQFGSGSEIFNWLEDSDNASVLAGTEFEGWTHDDSVKYMMEHHEELGYETVMKTSNDGTTDFFLVDLDGNVLEMDGTETGTVLDDRSDLTGRADGHDTITGSKAGDIIFGQEGNDTIRGGEGADTIYGGTGNDLLYGDGGDDFLFGGAGDDYLDGGEGRDTLYAGSGDDIIVYDGSDYLIDGGDGIDFMVSTDEGLSLDKLLTESGRDGNDGPIVNDVEVLITGKDALSLTNTEQLAKEYGITIGTGTNGDETLTLDMSKWHDNGNGSFDYIGQEGVDLTLETNLTPVPDTGDAEVQTQVFILNNTQG